MNNSKDINQVFILYSKGDFLGAKKLNDEILQNDPNNIYAKRYKKIIEGKIKNKKVDKKDKVRIKGKALKCPHCLAKIPFSSLNSTQKEAIKKGKYNNLEIKCPYCHTKFSLQKRKAPSVLELKIGDFAQIKGKKYRVTGYVDYLGNWYEGNYSGKLWYLEWILLGEKGDYKYFSEGGFYDDGDRNEEFEISQKIIPKFSFKPNYSSNYISINNEKIAFSEKNIVLAKSLYGENSKIFNVGEKVELYEFSFEGKDYVIEKEGVGSQTEAGIYQTKKISRRDAFKIFGKDYSNYEAFNSYYKGGKNFIENIVFYLIFGFIILVNIGEEIGLDSILTWKFLAIIILGFFIWVIFTKFENQNSRNILLGFIFIPILSFLSYYIFNSSLDTKKEISLENLDKAQKVELKFNNPNISKEKVVGRTRYDYGGIKTYYEKNVGLKFSVKSEDDKKIIKKINEIVKGDTTYGNSYDEDKIKEMFENEKIYLIRK